MKKTITDILNDAGIKNVGFCAFNDVKENLLECRAKSRIPQNAKTIIKIIDISFFTNSTSIALCFDFSIL